MFDKITPEVIYLGVPAEKTTAGVSPDGNIPMVILLIRQNFLKSLMHYIALLNNKNPLNKKSASDFVGGRCDLIIANHFRKIKSHRIRRGCLGCCNFKYAHAELTIQSITQLIAKFNETSRYCWLATQCW